MKSIKTFAFVSAIALVGMGFVACNQNNPEEQQTTVQERETVKTQFAISLPNSVAGNNGARRMPGTTVQASQDAAGFRGMKNVTLIPYTITGTLTEHPVAGTSNPNAHWFDLGAIAKSGVTDGITGDQNYRIYNDVFMPIGTNAVVLYATATDEASSNDHDFKTWTANETNNGNLQTYGGLTVVGLPLADASTTTDGIKFKPVQIQKNGVTANETAKKLAQYLTNIASATDGTTAWKDVTEVRLSELYTQFTAGSTLKDGMQAGSSASITAMADSLLKSINKLKALTGVGEKLDSQYDGIVSAILDSLKSSTFVTTSGSGVDEKVTLISALNNYPAEVFLPDGAAAVKWNTNKFEVVNTRKADDLTIAADTAYVYPASLYYFANSTIKASNNEKVSENFGNDAWWKLMKDKYADSTVNALTRSIAIKDTINYGVARLDVYVKGGSTLKDNGEVRDNIDASKFNLTAVLVSVQRIADWKFNAIDGDANKVNYIVYDTIGTPKAVPTTDYNTTPDNYTLLLESLKDEKINVALEFVNNDGDFRGINGQVIPKGTKFYLVGLLDPNASIGVNKNGQDKVFVQDHNTVAKFNIKDLSKAYNVIPDLRVPELELALSVDLSWQAGMVFDVDL